jgi:hypothetical protein
VFVREKSLAQRVIPVGLTIAVVGFVILGLYKGAMAHNLMTGLRNNEARKKVMTEVLKRHNSAWVKGTHHAVNLDSMRGAPANKVFRDLLKAGVPDSKAAAISRRMGTPGADLMDELRIAGHDGG